MGLEDNIDTVYNISVDRLGLEDNKGRHDRMVVGFTTTCATSAYHH
jgi:hypothetical protein